MKRVIALLLGIMILLSGINLSAAEETLEQKANRLNTLSILRGDGKSYNLAGTLTRQEAATFIVRLLGAEKEVLANKRRYSAVNFKDMKSTDWSAPYVGYCVEKGIINGYTDNTFRPTAKLELQAFSKLLLVSLGYVNDKDFKWETTLNKAGEIKLVTAEEIRLAKNNPFTRGDVVNLLNRVLRMKNVQSEKEMFYNLLKTDGITEQTLASVGLLTIRKEGANFVEDLKELAPGKFTIRFNIPPKAFSADNVVIVEETGRNLKVRSLKPTDLLNSFTFETDKPSDNTKYQILVRNVIDRNGNFFKEFKKEMISLSNAPIVSDGFLISQIKVLDKKTLEVEFTHPVSDSILNSFFYSVSQENKTLADGRDITVSLAGENKIKLKVKNPNFEEGQIYRLVINGEAKSKLGVRINGGKEDSRWFKGSKVEEAKFDVVNIEMLDRNNLRILLNKKVNLNTAQQVFSYYLTDSSNSAIKLNKATVLSSGESEEQYILLETERSLTEGRNYRLTVNQLYTESRSESILDKVYSFTAGITSNGTYDLSYASQVDPYTIEFGFDTAMDIRSATNAANYYLRKDYGGKTIMPSAIYHDFENSRMYLYLSEPLTERNISTYYLYAKTDIRGANGEQRKEQAKVSFSVTDPEVQKVAFEKVNYLGDNSIQLLFNEPIAKALPNLDVDNYSIVEKDTQTPLFIAGVRYIDGHRLTLNTYGFDRNKTYLLKVKEILEYNGKTKVTDLPVIEIERGNVVQ